MRFVLADQPPVTHPTVSLGCGNWCTFNYDSLISSALAVVVTVIAAILIARSMSSERPNRNVEPAIREYLPGGMEESFRGDAVAALPLSGTQRCGEIEFRRQCTPTGIHVHGRSGHPIRREEHQRRDETIEFHAGIQHGSDAVK